MQFCKLSKGSDTGQCELLLKITGGKKRNPVSNQNGRNCDDIFINELRFHEGVDDFFTTDDPDIFSLLLSEIVNECSGIGVNEFDKFVFSFLCL